MHWPSNSLDRSVRVRTVPKAHDLDCSSTRNHHRCQNWRWGTVRKSAAAFPAGRLRTTGRWWFSPPSCLRENCTATAWTTHRTGSSTEEGVSELGFLASFQKTRGRRVPVLAISIYASFQLRWIRLGPVWPAILRDSSALFSNDWTLTAGCHSEF